MNQCNIFQDVKIIFSDIDGTLINHENKQLNPTTVAVLQQLSKQGYPICLVTGRAYSPELQKILDEIQVVDYYCTCGGSFVTNVKTQQTSVIGTPIAKPVIKAMVDLAKRNQRGLILATNNHQIYNFYFGADEKEEINSQEYFNGGTEVLNYDDNQMVDQIIDNHEIVHIVYKAEPEKIWPCVDEMKQLADQYHTSFAVVGNCFMEIEDDGINKATAIQYILDQYHLSSQNAIFFGDSANDLPAFLLCKYSCQLGNLELLKNFATYQLGNPKDPVIGEFLKKEILDKINNNN